MSTVTFNYGPEDIAETKHICYFTRPSFDNQDIILFEVVEYLINHPEAPEEAYLPTLSIERVKEGKREQMPESVLLEANERNIVNLIKAQGE